MKEMPEKKERREAEHRQKINDELLDARKQ